jgi:DNA-binding transcriptional ArsR family regulator
VSNAKSTASARRYAEGYVRRGLAVVPIPEGRKRPVIPAWQTMRLCLEDLDDHFNGRPQNVGILLGEPSGWVVDVDLDAPEAVELAPRFLPPTLKSGREGAPRSHWWYRSSGARTEKWKDTDGATLVELRSTGCQTVVEPSTHPDGGRYLWHHEAAGPPGGHAGITEVAREGLVRACRSLATAALVARRLPPVGGRHDFALALAGFLLKGGRMGEEDALRLMEAAWNVAGAADREAHRDLAGIVRDTARNLASGAEVVGGGRLEELSPGVRRLLARWWGWAQDRAREEGATEERARNKAHSAFSSVAELMARQIPPVRWVVPGMVPEGVALLAGKPKLGKSWLALGLCVAVASGGVAFGNVRVEKGAALYLALEDNERRLQFRLKKILAGEEVPEDLHYSVECPRLGEGGAEAMEGWLRSRPDARLVVIDTLAKIRPRQRRGANAYQEDYEALEALLPLAARHNVAMLVVHHLRKMAASDPLDEVNSSIGLTGGVDGAIILKRERTRADATLFVAGRDVEEEKEFALRWDQNTAGWALVGDAGEYRLSQERAAILDLLRRSAPEPLGPKAIAEALDKPYSAVTTLLQKLVRDGLVRSPRYGRYEPAADAPGGEVSPEGSPPENLEDRTGTQSFTTFTTFNGRDGAKVAADEDKVSFPSGETEETGETPRGDAENSPDDGENADETLDECRDEGEGEAPTEEGRVREVLRDPPGWMRDTYLKGYREGRWDAGLVANSVATALGMAPHEDGPRIRQLVEGALEELGIEQG